MPYQNIVLNGDTLADKGVALDFTIIPNPGVLLDFNERPNFGVVTDFAPVKVDEIRNFHVGSKKNVRSDSLKLHF